MTHQKWNVVGPLGSGWDRPTGWNSLCSAVFSLLHSVTAVMVSSGLPIVVCVLCVSLLPSVRGEFKTKTSTPLQRSDSKDFLKTPCCLPLSPWPRVFCVAADSCESYWDTSGKHHGSQMCLLKFCCGSCSQRYCCNDRRYELTEKMQKRCPQR